MWPWLLRDQLRTQPRPTLRFDHASVRCRFDLLKAIPASSKESSWVLDALPSPSSKRQKTKVPAPRTTPTQWELSSGTSIAKSAAESKRRDLEPEVFIVEAILASRTQNGASQAREPPAGKDACPAMLHSHLRVRVLSLCGFKLSLYSTRVFVVSRTPCWLKLEHRR